MSINGLLGTISQESKALESAKRIFDLVDEIPAVPPDGGRIIPEFRGDIELQNVWFKYPTRAAWVMKDVSMKISAGEIIAVVGHSGSGKSTLVQLLLRFYEVTQGRVLLDGVDIRQLDPRWLHQVVGVVQQEPILFAMTVRENVCYGVPEEQYISDDEIYRHLEAAQAKHFVGKLPEGLDTLIGEKGSTLSGGQRQRIAIARTMIREPTVMITDEATSALDAQSERKVQLALDEVMKGRTSIIIAHRLGTIRAAKMIYVFESGELVESGTHEQLVERQGSYFTLVQRQLTSTS
jgi:ABC-type multidrug transport system fused ATPase/permease subunit